MSELCKLCQISDFGFMREDIERIFPGMENVERRKVWEIVQAVRAVSYWKSGLARMPRVLFVGAGAERTIFYFSNFAEVHATDLYIRGGWSNWAPADMLIAPQKHADGPCDPQHIVVQHMDGRDLRYPDNWFDAVICTSSIEHFGDWHDVQQSAHEMGRVLNNNGRLVITTEFEINGRAGRFNENGLAFNEETLQHHIIEPSGYVPVEPLDLTFTDEDRAAGQDLDRIMDLERLGLPVPMPHTLLRQNGYEFTSVSLVMEKAT
jgi:SAM-dependent methyltransferase